MHAILAAILFSILAGCSFPEPESPPEFFTHEKLDSLPYAQSVEVTPATGKPTKQIIHVLNWHYVPRDAFAADPKSLAGGSLTDAEIERQWESFLDEVKTVQLQQKGLLSELASYGIEAVYLEGHTDADLEGCNSLAARLRDWT